MTLSLLDDFFSPPTLPSSTFILAAVGVWSRIDAAPRVVCARGRIGARGMPPALGLTGNGESVDVCQGWRGSRKEAYEDGRRGPWRWSVDRPSMVSPATDGKAPRSVDCPGCRQGGDGTGSEQGQAPGHGVQDPSGMLMDSRVLGRRVEHGTLSGRITTLPSSTTSRRCGTPKRRSGQFLDRTQARNFASEEFWMAIGVVKGWDCGLLRVRLHSRLGSTVRGRLWISVAQGRNGPLREGEC
ncbi:hypothetical protein FB45DRAFT_939276 [Roridomyces roridus]|uniref:Uncharacterized protein n=1 Tax=Roridomyces roridus TaxID=1738132 RepID=A0AAD7B7K1_9AGAR|nr:hypothetical protein FB45DRAFT_939276 [Roridomyces roridus]